MWNPFKLSIKSRAGRRKAYRARISGLHVKVVGRPGVYVASDLSPTGVGLKGSTGMREGKVLEISLFHKGRTAVSGIRARVVRATQTFTGLVFVDMPPCTTDAVHSLVLAEQKRQADERCKGKDTGSCMMDF